VKNKKLQKIKNNFVYRFTVFALWFFNIIPRKMALFLGSGLGCLAFMVSKKERATAHKTLTMVYGDSMDETQREGLIKRMFINFGLNLADVIRFKKHYHRQIKNLVDVEGIEHFDNVYKRGKGIIAVTGHIGNFELLAAYFANAGYNAAAIGREMYDPRLDKLLVENRTSLNVVNIPTTESPRRILKVLKQGYALGVLIDTDSMRVRSEFVPAFGKLSRTPIGQTIIGLKTGAGFLPMACIRDGKRYKIIIKPEVVPDPSGDFDKDVYNITAACTKALEEIIDEHRDQWIWIHNRWLTRPVDEKDENDDKKDNEKDE